jgi:hypothetical protein
MHWANGAAEASRVRRNGDKDGCSLSFWMWAWPEDLGRYLGGLFPGEGGGQKEVAGRARDLGNAQEG